MQFRHHPLHRSPSSRVRWRPWRRWLGIYEDVSHTHRVRTRDGTCIAVHRVRTGDGGVPVLLLHGLSANRLTFHFPGRSLARYLAEHGYDCFVPELRGSGMSDKPPSWDFDDYLHGDLPSILDYVRHATGGQRFHWIGHSMGGILMMAYAIRGGEAVPAEIASGTSIGSCLDYAAGSGAFERLRHLLPALSQVPRVPWGTFVHWMAPLSARWSTPLGEFNLHLDNIEPQVARRLYANGFESIPSALLRSLATTFEHRGLRSTDGIYYLERTADLRIPVCMLAGTVDRQCSVSAVRATAERFTSTGPRVLAFGREHGHASDYGHFDLILGKRATTEVWPEILHWLRAHPG